MHFTFSYVSAFGLVDRLTHWLQAHDLLAGFVLAALPSQHPSSDRGLSLSLERRRSPRIPFLASAEIIDETENTRSTSQLSDLSLHGCFVQLPNPFPEGTPVTIEIYKDEVFVETAATVAYFMPKRGMGLTFTEPQFASVLKKWITKSKSAAPV
jgi:hypothetical protein